MLDSKFVILGTIVALFGLVDYLRDTLAGKVKPNRVSWLLWAIAPLIAFAAEIQKGVGLQSLMTFSVGFGPLLVFTASFVSRKGTWKLSNFDYICGALSIIGLMLWLVTREGNLAILFAIFADALAAIPTVIKSYKAPETESSLVFLLSAFSAGITLLTIDHWDFAHYGFPAYIFAICALLFVLIKFKTGVKKLNTAN